MKKARYNRWKILQKNMEKCTNNAILETISMGYRSVTNEVPEDYGPGFSNKEKYIRHCFTEQSKIGRKNFFHGRVARSWGEMNRILLLKKLLDEDSLSSK
jgi:hypothetical protein